MAIQKITADVISSDAITTASISDSAITAAKLAGTLDLTGKTITVATASSGDNDTSIASTAFVQQEIASLVDSAPGTLNTLNELAAALGDDANFSTTVTNSIATKAPLATPQFTNRVGIGIAAHATAALNITNTTQHIRLNNGSELAAISVLSTGELDIWGHGDGETINFRTGTGSGTVAMNVVGTNVGIGESSPDAPLHITSNTPIISFDESDASQEYRIGSFGGTFALYDSTDSAYRLAVDGSGNVGIGTTSPASALEVNNLSAGDTVATFEGSYGSGGDVQLVRYERSGGAVYGAISYKDATTDMEFGNISSHALSFTTANTRRMTIDSSGNVGIGTSSPAAKLDVSSVFQFFDDVSPEIKIVDSDDNNYALVGYSDGTMTLSSNHGNEAGGADVIQFLTGGSEKMRIDSDARLAINNTTSAGDGNLNDQVKLVCGGGVVVGSAAGSNNSFLQYTDAGGLTVLQGSGTYGLRIFDDNSSTPRLTVFRSGNVGINNNSPDNKLQVNVGSSSAGTDSISVQNNGVSSANHTTGLRFQFNTAVPSAIRSRLTNTSNGEGTLSFYTSSNGSAANLTERMTIDSSGRVQINTTNPSPVNVGNHYFVVELDSSTAGIAVGADGLTDSRQPMTFYNDNGTVGSIITSGSSTSYNTSSDYRLKENVDYEFNALDRVTQLKPARFNFIADADTTLDGFLAHEVSDIVPEAIHGEKDGEEMQSIDQSKLVPLLTKAIQEQQTIIDDLKSRIETLEG